MNYEWKFPAAIDNTMMKDWRRCPQYFMRKHCHGLQVKEDEISIDLHFGAAFAKGIERARRAYFVESLPQVDSVDHGIAEASKTYGTRIAPSRSAKTLDNLVNAIYGYFQQWPMDEDNLVPLEGGIEHEFTVRLPINSPVSGEPLLYCGRMDMLAHDRETGNIVVVDEKTASRFTDSWFAKWDMDTQLSGYLYAAQAHCAPLTVPQGLIRGVGVSSSGVNFVRASIFRTQHQLDLWWLQLLRDVCDAIVAFNNSLFHYRMGDSCYTYSRPCEYTRLCTSPNPESFLEQYDVRFWEPLKRSDK